MAAVRLITFFVPLPEPLAVPDGMTVSFEEEGLSGVDPSMPAWIAPGIPQDERVAGKNFVSLKVWQQTSSMVQFQEQMRVAASVARLETSLGRVPSDETAPPNR